MDLIAIAFEPRIVELACSFVTCGGIVECVNISFVWPMKDRLDGGSTSDGTGDDPEIGRPELRGNPVWIETENQKPSAFFQCLGRMDDRNIVYGVNFAFTTILERRFLAVPMSVFEGLSVAVS